MTEDARPPSVLVASNRGPLAHSLVDGQLTARRGGGGLVSALSSLAGDPSALWVCAPMNDADRQAAEQASPRGRLDAGGLAVLLLDIDADTSRDAYDGISNSTLWFLHHQLFDLPVEPSFDAAFAGRWASYVRFNDTFAGALAEQAAEGATVLVQDYHLCLTPRQLRERRPDLRIGHFSHTPWAPPSTFRLLPASVRRAVLEGVLGADSAGFLSPRWAAAFAECCVEFLGATSDGSSIEYDGRRTELSVHALGVDGKGLASSAHTDEVGQRLESLDFAGRQVVVRVDRTELSKNIVRGFAAFAELLRTRPEFRGQVVHAALAYPSRGGLAAYQRYLDEVQQAADAVNEEFATASWRPVELFLDDDYPKSLALLRRADVLLINPVRDGMNLVAKEGVLLSEHDAALVLSTEAGAADQMGEAALLINPFDVSATAAALAEALSMPAQERHRRAETLRAVATALPPTAWFGEQVELLQRLG